MSPAASPPRGKEGEKKKDKGKGKVAILEKYIGHQTILDLIKKGDPGHKKGDPGQKLLAKQNKTKQQ